MVYTEGFLVWISPRRASFVRLKAEHT